VRASPRRPERCLLRFANFLNIPIANLCYNRDIVFIKGKHMLKGVKQTAIGILAVFSALTLSACSGGGDSGGSGSSATELKSGVYNIGRLFSNGSTKEGLSLISPTGKFVANLDKASFTFGNISFSASGDISGTIDEFILGPPWKITSGSLSGQVVSSDEANLRAQKDSLSTNSVLLRIPASSDTGLTLEKISTTYNMSDPGKDPVITIAPDGAITGGTGVDQRDCVFNGQVTIPDESTNVFELTYTASLCANDPDEDALGKDRDGEFSGLGTYNASEGELLFYARNKVVAWKFLGTR